MQNCMQNAVKPFVFMWTKEFRLYDRSKWRLAYA